MRKIDVIFAIICGLAVAWIASDFFNKYKWLFLFVLPILSIIGLWLTDLIGKKMLFARQAGKFVLAGAFADAIDIKVFQFLFLFIQFSILLKAISFVIATFVKYYSDKHWTFEKHENDHAKREMAYFFLVATVGMAINVVSFYFFGKIRTGLADKIWTEMCIILAALVTATWNFCGYKFIVFKK